MRESVKITSKIIECWKSNYQQFASKLILLCNLNCFFSKSRLTKKHQHIQQMVLITSTYWFGFLVCIRNASLKFYPQRRVPSPNHLLNPLEQETRCFAFLWEMHVQVDDSGCQLARTWEGNGIGMVLKLFVIQLFSREKQQLWEALPKRNIPPFHAISMHLHGFLGCHGMPSFEKSTL